MLKVKAENSFVSLAVFLYKVIEAVEKALLYAFLALEGFACAFIDGARAD